METDIDTSLCNYCPQTIIKEAILAVGQTAWYSDLHQQRFVKTLELIKKHIDLTKNSRILEVGSWPNYFTVALHKTGAQVTATDLESERIKILKQFNIPVVKIDLHHLESLLVQYPFFYFF